MIRKYRIKDAIETENIIEKQRMVKTDEEIENIEKACKITDDCFEYLINFIKIGMTEKRIALEIEKYFIEHNADGLAFETIVASGVNSSKPHSTPSDKIIRDGDVITIDFGAKYNGYSADMTRTVFAGHISSEMEKLYKLILKNQLHVTKNMKEGVSCKMLARSVESDFYLYNYSLIHALGHRSRLKCS